MVAPAMRLPFASDGPTARRSSAWEFLLRSTLLFTNSLLGVVGIVILCYAAFAYAEFHRAVSPPHKGKVPYPWFIAATAGTGGTTTLTASAGVLAACTLHSYALNLYAVMLAAILTGQLGFALIVFVDKGWRKWPPDPSGEYDKLREWVQSNEDLCLWLGLGLLAFQVFAVAISCTLSGAAQQFEDDSDEEEAGWTGAISHDISTPPSTTAPLLGSATARGASGLRSPSGQAAAAQLAGLGRRRDDAWSRRMREKYGLDTSAFSYEPAASCSGAAGGASSRRSSGDGGGPGAKCALM